ncbi:type I-E CRISPR-associated protein Cas6/Cse3/CasE [Lancefieldella sp. Marseille-Q7238]|uniref:type I-E CRISPR-associated protein Cas6/Cse3/CasE n=1 Tax=Lancefieldella sp. Marseille-Q7238 TaxID=3022127 RepID=UPI0024A98377|nr:type I-E CRISPR-associated protein Cas6/Cse3/CasE [Lancefieldella sp. Marseille-Q7238]
MYFTRFPINLTRRETRHMLASPYRMHAAIAGSFPPDVPMEEEGRVLWRVDWQKNGGAYLYVVSPTSPSLVGLNEQIGFPDLSPSWQTRDYNPFLDHLAVGQRYAFRLVANPVVNRSSRGGKQDAINKQGSQMRLPHLTILQQEAWLVGKAAYNGTNIEVPELFLQQDSTRASRNGFEVLQDARGISRLIVSNTRELSFHKESQKQPITLAIAQYDGLLRVTDITALRHALINGIGHGKGFGCGLLTLAAEGGSGSCQA